MGIFKDFIILVVGIFVIIKSADLFTSAAEGIALFFKIPRVIIGLTIVSIATTTPEFAVSALSAKMGAGGIALGNATGSCMANIGLILAAAAVIRTLHFDPRLIRQELVFLIGFSVLVFLLMLDGVLGFSDGILLCVLMGAFFSYIILRELKTKSREGPTQLKSKSINKDVVKFIIGSAGVVAAAKYAIIPSGVAIANYFKVPEIVVAVSMIAIGTSLPELVTAVVASLKKMGELAAGNVIGANILNLLWVLGVSSIIRPLNIDSQTKLVTMPLVIGFALLIFLFTRKKLVLQRAHGFILMFLYSGYLLYIIKFAYK
ncbi:MAG: calcium/sodium antiporter [Candidatus Omnitrophica bacterium]|nr:calcium/sodium antiporter [Candidatus Omnitrophota bacterium]